MDSLECNKCNTNRPLRYFKVDTHKLRGFAYTCKLCFGISEDKIKGPRIPKKDGKKYCGRCRNYQNLENFPKVSGRLDGAWCKPCLRENTSEWAKINKNNVNTRFYRFKYYSKRRGINFELTRDDFINLLSKPCFYCGETLKGISGSQVDRKDNNKNVGYTLSNSVPCCTDCNMIKGCRLTPEEMLVAMEAILKYRKENT